MLQRNNFLVKWNVVTAVVWPILENMQIKVQEAADAFFPVRAVK